MLDPLSIALLLAAQAMGFPLVNYFNCLRVTKRGPHFASFRIQNHPTAFRKSGRVVVFSSGGEILLECRKGAQMFIG